MTIPIAHDAVPEFLRSWCHFCPSSRTERQGRYGRQISIALRWTRSETPHEYTLEFDQVNLQGKNVLKKEGAKERHPCRRERAEKIEKERERRE